VHTLAGPVLTEGDAPTGAPAWRTAGHSGTGVKVGIIDMGFSGYTALMGSELPSSVTAANFVDFEGVEEVDGTDPHGTACAEIIHDVAPGAQLYLAKVETSLDVEEAATWMIGQGVKVISMSLGTTVEGPGDGTGWLADVVDSARAAGVSWFIAAGNEREQHWGGQSNIVSDLHVFHAGSGQNINYFGPGPDQAYMIPGGYTFTVAARWSDWTAPVNQDFDVFLVRWSGANWELMSSYGMQFGGMSVQSGGPGQLPVEFAVGQTWGAATAYGFAVARYSATRNVNFDFFASAPLEERVAARSLSGPADSPAAITVGAIDVATYVAEPYSSQGPTNGPGGTATGGVIKPDLSAYANVSTAAYGYKGFNGTSAATPHAAGAAALALHRDPTLTPTGIASFLASRAIDLGTAGKDNRYGSGRVNLGLPSAGDTTPPVVGAPDVDLRSVAVTSTGKVGIRVDFTASDPSGIKSTALQQKVATNSFTSVTLPSTTATGVNLAYKANGTARQFRASATDSGNNAAGWTTAPAITLRAFQNGGAGVTQAGSWSSVSSTSYYGGSVRHSATAGRTQTVTAAMSDVALVTTFGPNRGIAQVYVNGALNATIDLYASTTQFRRVAWTHEFGALGTHTVALRVTGTKRSAATAARVDFDAFVIVGP
jgi:subtilisin family serine protease